MNADLLYHDRIDLALRGLVGMSAFYVVSSALLWSLGTFRKRLVFAACATHATLSICVQVAAYYYSARAIVVARNDLPIVPDYAAFSPFFFWLTFGFPNAYLAACAFVVMSLFLLKRMGADLAGPRTAVRFQVVVDIWTGAALLVIYLGVSSVRIP